ncbi:sarcoplasmic/endoplasmic reticulum calcium ATPase regulator ARLN [Vulpes vulpes]|uniref:Sarcoplasmic/endoplasmic reticulum calcium ATPase regulator ARLN n=1 Tax=Vulpes vulpes TaxID=9627 RepID=A0A3Q7TVM0_VULVU|nr:uncharacterized protein C4orf3 homolog [Vulpes vulpes]
MTNWWTNLGKWIYDRPPIQLSCKTSKELSDRGNEGVQTFPQGAAEPTGAAPRTPRPGGGRAACRAACRPSRRQQSAGRRLRAGRRGDQARFRGGERACVGGTLWPFEGKANPEVRHLRDFWLRRGDDWWVMEAGAAAEDGRDGPRERLRLGEAGRQQQNHEVRPQSTADRFPKHSYWLDLWLFILFDVVLFIFVYLLP